MVCKIEEMNKGGAYPRSCPECGLGGKCKKGLKVHPEYIALWEGTRWVEGDQRSRDHPGHGYPAGNETTYERQTFTDLAELKRWIGGFSYNKSLQIYKLTPVKVTTEVVVNVA